MPVVGAIQLRVREALKCDIHSQSAKFIFLFKELGLRGVISNLKGRETMTAGYRATSKVGYKWLLYYLVLS
jgi:hypothetical protein